MRETHAYTIAWGVGAVVLILSAAVAIVLLGTVGSESSTTQWVACIDAGRQMVRGVCL